MTTINLKRYYPYMTENVMLEVSDEIAAAEGVGRSRICCSIERGLAAMKNILKKSL